MTICHAVTAALLLSVPAVASGSVPHADTVRVSEFGVRPYSYENCVDGLKQALRACRDRGASVLLFDGGRYDIWPEGAERREWFITNSSTEEECPSKVKTVGLLIEDMQGLTVEGRGAELVFHGKMITVAVSHCRDIVLRGLAIDFERPGMSEMTYVSSGADGTVVDFHPDSRYGIDTSGRISLIGEGWKAEHFHCIEYDPDTKRSFYSGGWDVLRSSYAEELSRGKVLFRTPADFSPKPGNTLSVRDIIRDHIGLFIHESAGVRIEDVKIYYMQGPGIVSQFSDDLTMSRVDCSPRKGGGRLIASSADFMHFSGCGGRIGIFDCNFAGAHDDPINIHGTNLRVVEKLAPDRLLLRFMHGQSYGFKAFSPGDTVAFINAETMQRMSYAVVRETERVSDRLVELSFDRAVPDVVSVGLDCVENITCTPEVEIRRCRFTRTNTRGTLVTTPRKVVIADNVYCKTGMSAILIEADVKDWYESGPVCDVLIENNLFIDCAWLGGPEKAVIALHPSNAVADAGRPVHRNVRIVDNSFITCGNPVLYAKSTAGLRFTDNSVAVGPADGSIECDCCAAGAEERSVGGAAAGLPASYIILEGCADPVIEGNSMTEFSVKSRPND